MIDEVSKIMELLDNPNVDGETVKKLFQKYPVDIKIDRVKEGSGSTDFLKIIIPSNKDSRILGIIGQLGGVSAYPEVKGLVSDADGAIVALSSALKLAKMKEKGIELEGDVIITTHICPDAPIVPHDPVPFMDSHVSTKKSNKYLVDERMDAIISIDATKGNRIHNQNGFAITPTIKDGWILKVSEDLLDIQERVTGEPPSTLTTTMQDITPYGNDIHHINSIFQPGIASNAPLVGVATTSVSPVPGSATGSNYEEDLVKASKFVVEVAKDFISGKIEFYDEKELKRLKKLYGPIERLQGKS
ncbi:MAG: DUF1177 domain-containing protein [Thermoplasmatota archaeon]